MERGYKNMDSKNKVAVIGSGVGGLAIAIRLAIKGYKVSVFEANEYIGGKLSNIDSGEFRFDAGPSLFTMPALVDELFILAGKNLSENFKYNKLNEICRYFWSHEKSLIVNSDLEEFDKEVVKLFNENPNAVKKYLDASAKKYETLAPLFLEKSLHKFSTWFSKDAFKGYIRILRMGIFKTLHAENQNAFKSIEMVQLFDRYATYNGSDPNQTPGTMGIIPHLEYNIGAFFPEGGMRSITDALFELGKELGVNYTFNTKISKIEVSNKEVKGLWSEETYLGDFENIISNMDVTPTYTNLLKDQKAPLKILNQEKSGSGLIFYWGVKGNYSKLGLHNILFSENYSEEFRHQFSLRNIYDDPTVYINISSKLKHTDAPVGHENWFVLINAPHEAGQNWEEIIERTKKNIIVKVKKILDIDLNELIVTEEILDPRKIKLKTSSDKGALYGNSSNNRFAAFLRHPNRSKKIKNLYFVGGSVHPGGGIPLALSSAKIVDSYFKNTK